MNLYESTWEHFKRKLFVFSFTSLLYLFHRILSFQEYSWCPLNWRHFESSLGFLFLISILINVGLLFLPLFTFFTADWHKVSTKPYLVLCCYFYVLPVGHFVSNECKENSGTEKWIVYHWVHPCLVFTQNASSGEVFIFGWRIIFKCLLYFCTELYIAYIFLKFHIAPLFSVPHIQKLFVLALCNV